MAEKTIDILAGKLPFSILTDLPSPEEWHKRCRQACSTIRQIDTILSLIEQGFVPNEHGRKIKFREDDITVEQAELLFYLTTEVKPILTVETGFDHGLVTAIFAAAHMYNELKGGHVPIQAQPKYVMEGVGFYTLEKLGLSLYQVMEHESAMVLPQMYLQKLSEGLGIVYLNSATEFDEQMMEYFYLNRLLQEGGIIAINTAASARRELVDYIRTSRFDYAVREMSCGITLVQLPQPLALAQHNPRFRH
jgi:hypothetical protein